MLYKFLGMAVWHGGKVFLRSRYGSSYPPKPFVAGAVVVVVAAVVLAAAAAAARRNGSTDG